MKKLDFYEFTGVFLPGALFIMGLTMQFKILKELLFSQGIVPAVGFIVVAYGTGHLLQCVGNLWENIWWLIRGGKPTEWLLNPQKDNFNRWKKKVFECFNIAEDCSLNEFRLIVREIYALVRDAGKNERVDIFNGNYGMFRGFSAAAITLIVIYLMFGVPQAKTYIILVLILISSTYRMNRFSVNYAKELYVQFTTISTRK